MVQLTYEEFVDKEIETNGIDYVCDLFDGGFEPTPLRNEQDGKERWVWLFKAASLVSNRYN